jgi:RNA polymerase sigma factor (sigma-70 family)
MGEREMGERDEFRSFVEEVEPRLRSSLVALCGPERAREAVQEALIYAWEHWERVREMTNPAGYLYRVARSRIRWRRPVRLLAAEDETWMPEVEPALDGALGRLTERQRVVVLLVEGADWTYEEVAQLLDVSVSTVRKHLSRGLDRLRTQMGVSADV